MSEDDTFSGKAIRRGKESWKPLLIGAVAMFLADNGIEKLLNRVFPDTKSELVKVNEKLDVLQKSVDKIWQIKGNRERTVEP